MTTWERWEFTVHFIGSDPPATTRRSAFPDSPRMTTPHKIAQEIAAEGHHYFNENDCHCYIPPHRIEKVTYRKIGERKARGER